MSETSVDFNRPQISTTIDATCGHWVQRKKRYCKMTVAKDRKFCGEHEPPATSVSSDKYGGASRVPCPLDPMHTVYKRNIEKHLKICNARARDSQPDYIKIGINAVDAKMIDNTTKCMEDNTKIKLTELSDEEFYGVIDKVKDLYAKYVKGQIGIMANQHQLLQKELANEDYGKESRKHLLQAAALLGILECEQQLQDDTSYIEFGAGKGQLAFFLAQLIQKEQQNSQVVLLDRMSLRHKKDNKIEDRTLVHRIRVDIADFYMNGLPELQRTKRTVAVSKHLCGGATDLSLRCITQQSSLQPTQYVMIAVCCHHRCDWSSYVGKQFFEREHVNQRQFTIITKMVSWAICGTGMSRERRRALAEQHEAEEPQNLRLTLEKREEVGRMCKRILDYGRLEYLQKHGYKASLQYYVPRDVTLENVCLLAKKTI